LHEAQLSARQLQHDARIEALPCLDRHTLGARRQRIGIPLHGRLLGGGITPLRSGRYAG